MSMALIVVFLIVKSIKKNLSSFKKIKLFLMMGTSLIFDVI